MQPKVVSLSYIYRLFLALLLSGILSLFFLPSSVFRDLIIFFNYYIPQYVFCYLLTHLCLPSSLYLNQKFFERKGVCFAHFCMLRISTVLRACLLVSHYQAQCRDMTMWTVYDLEEVSIDQSEVIIVVSFFLHFFYGRDTLHSHQ